MSPTSLGSQRGEDILAHLIAKLAAASSFATHCGHYRMSFKIKTIARRVSRISEQGRIPSSQKKLTVNSDNGLIECLLYCQYLCVLLNLLCMKKDIHQLMVENIGKNKDLPEIRDKNYEKELEA